MKNLSILLLLGFVITHGCKPDKLPDLKKQYRAEGLGEIEYYDFEKTDGGRKDTLYETEDGWLIDIWSKEEDVKGIRYEYAPATDFYEIIKYYHPNGMIKERGKYMCGLLFGKWEYFDEEGNLIRVDDEDAKFKGIEMTREDVLQFLEREGWINRRTGKTKIYFADKIRTLPTNGEFYKRVRNNIGIGFTPAVWEDGKEKTPPIWGIGIATVIELNEYIISYTINAHTGEYYVKKKKKIILFDDHEEATLPGITKSVYIQLL